MTATPAATVHRVGNPKRVLTAEDEQAIRDVLNRAQAVQDEVRAAVLSAHAHGASVRSLAEFTGMSTNTIMRWKKDGR